MQDDAELQDTNTDDLCNQRIRYAMGVRVVVVVFCDLNVRRSRRCLFLGPLNDRLVKSTLWTMSSVRPEVMAMCVCFYVSGQHQVI